MVFLDGIRHAAEIADLAYDRLQGTLTEISSTHRTGGEERPQLYTAAFLDAWALVDALDRCRSLLGLMPGVTEIQSEGTAFSFRDQMQPIRDLRNVADHLAQRIDYVIARDSAALGILSWFTCLDAAAQTGLSCTILPGTVTRARASIVNPAGKEFSPPTDLIHLAAGEHSASLSDAMRYATAVLTQVERSVEQSLADHGVLGQQAASDILVVVELSFADDASAEDG